MKQILIYGDSLTWGIVPDTRQRLDFSVRWPGVLEAQLSEADGSIRIIENCLNGRRSVWDDPFKAGRNGSHGLSEAIEINSPLALVIIALGTNDFQDSHDNQAWASAQGIAALIRIVEHAPIEPGMPLPRILVLAPPVILKPKGTIATKFRGAEQRCVGFPAALRAMAAENAVQFFDINTVTSASKVDGIHLDADQHRRVGVALAPVVSKLLAEAK